MSQDESFPYIDTSVSPKKSSSNALVIVLAVCGVFGLLCLGGGGLLMMNAFNSAREAARSTQCKNNLKNLSQAMFHYEATHGTLPPAYTTDKNGKPLHSWRVLLLPYIGEEELFKQIRLDEPWDSPHNRQFADRMPSAFYCPSAPDGSPKTHYVVIRGPKTAFPGKHPVNHDAITDGPWYTLGVVEYVGEPVNWMKPEDVTPEKFLAQFENDTKGHHAGGLNVAMLDGTIRVIPFSTPRKIVSALITRNGMEAIDPDF